MTWNDVASAPALARPAYQLFETEFVIHQGVVVI